MTETRRRTSSSVSSGVSGARQLTPCPFKHKLFGLLESELFDPALREPGLCPIPWLQLTGDAGERQPSAGGEGFPPFIVNFAQSRERPGTALRRADGDPRSEKRKSNQALLRPGTEGRRFAALGGGDSRLKVRRANARRPSNSTRQPLEEPLAS